MELTLNNIVLVPTDFSEVCDNAINQACDAARFLQYKVVLLHIINSDTRTWIKKEGLDEADVLAKLKTLASEKATTYSVTVDAMVQEGSIFTAIGDVASEIKADLIFLGTHGKSGIQHLTGSYALKVVTSSPVPVIVVQKRPFNKGYHDIILPITSDAGPLDKTRWAAYIAKKFNAKVHLFLINNDTSILEASKVIKEFMDEQGVEHITSIAERESGFSRQVIDYATSKNADLILIMTSPDKNWTSFILGTYDEEMIFNTSQIPTMCINPRKYNWEKIFDF